jgi:hypothetical protein
MVFVGTPRLKDRLLTAGRTPPTRTTLGSDQTLPLDFLILPRAQCRWIQ